MMKNNSKVLAFFDDIMNDRAIYILTTLKKLILHFSKVKSDDESKILKKFIANYKFKSFKNYLDFIEIIKLTRYRDGVSTIYHVYSELLIDTILNNNTFKPDWLLSIFTTDISAYECKELLASIPRNYHNPLEKYYEIFEIVKNSKNESLILSYLLLLFCDENDEKYIPLVNDIFEFVINNNININQRLIVLNYTYITNENLKIAFGVGLYKITKDEEYLPSNIKDIFVF